LKCEISLLFAPAEGENANHLPKPFTKQRILAHCMARVSKNLVLLWPERGAGYLEVLHAPVVDQLLPYLLLTVPVEEQVSQQQQRHWCVENGCQTHVAQCFFAFSKYLLNCCRN
jgi:hypothetical protein